MIPTPAPKGRAIFGREPSAWVGLVEALIALLIMFPAVNAAGLTQEWATIVLAVVSAAAGVFTAWATRDTMLGAILGLVKAGVGLVAFYGFALTTDQQGALLAAVAVLVGFFQRTQTTPVDRPLDPSPQQVVQSQAVPDALPEEGEARQVTADTERAGMEEQFAAATAQPLQHATLLPTHDAQREVVPADEEPDKRTHGP
jgi:hypothetical protein